MASTLTQYSNTININFPVSGEDNDTQGFRTNFARIQSALTVASEEITTIQLNAVNLSDTNDFGNNVAKRIALQASSEVVYNAGSISNVVTVDYALGSYQTFILTPGSYTLTVVNWPPTENCGSIKLDIRPTTTSTTTVNLGGVTYTPVGTTLPKQYTQTAPVIWELWSPDNGNTVFAKETAFH